RSASMGGMLGRLQVHEVLDGVLRDARLVAGAAGASRHVGRARVAVTAEELRRVVPGELVVSTVAALAGTGEPWDGVTARLADQRVAALALADDVAHVPGALVAAADARSLPLLVLAAGT